MNYANVLVSCYQPTGNDISEREENLGRGLVRVVAANGSVDFNQL
jgi:hypothetical protein